LRREGAARSGAENVGLQADGNVDSQADGNVGLQVDKSPNCFSKSEKVGLQVDGKRGNVWL
jgi:hypothetical protein